LEDRLVASRYQRTTFGDHVEEPALVIAVIVSERGALVSDQDQDLHPHCFQRQSIFFVDHLIHTPENLLQQPLLSRPIRDLDRAKNAWVLRILL
jgi:hypothetical protein